MAKRLGIEIEGLDRAIFALQDVSQEARYAQATAFRAARRSAASQARKQLAARWGVPMKVFRHRLQSFFIPGRAKGRQAEDGDYVRLWLGLKGRPTAREHPRVRRAIAQHGGVRVGRWVYLPIERGAEAIMLTAVRAAAVDKYLPTLRKDFKRRIRKAASKRGARRRR